jgi:hypothetical protein
MASMAGKAKKILFSLYKGSVVFLHSLASSIEQGTFSEGKAAEA